MTYNISHNQNTAQTPPTPKFPPKEYYLRRMFLHPLLLGLGFFTVFLLIDLVSILVKAFSPTFQWNGYIIIPFIIPIMFVVAIVQGALMGAKLPFFIFPWNIQALGRRFLTGLTFMVFIFICISIFILLFMIYGYIKLFFIT